MTRPREALREEVKRKKQEGKRRKLEAKRDRIEAKLAAVAQSGTGEPRRSAEGEGVAGPSIELPPVVFEHSQRKGHGK